MEEKERRQLIKELVMEGSLPRSLLGRDSVFPQCRDPSHKCVCGQKPEHDSVAEKICLCKRCFKILKNDWWNPGGKGQMA